MLARLPCHAVLGLDACPVMIETDLAWGVPAFTMVGLPDTALRESRERVRAGITNSGYEFPLRRITVNLAPADVRKEGPSFDLPIALSLLAASGQLKSENPGLYSAAGELSLDGAVREINGALAIAAGARQAGHRGLLVPVANAREAALIDGIEVIAVESLRQAAGFLAGEESIAPTRVDAAGLLKEASGACTDLVDVRGQDSARRALEIAAAGGHNLLMAGPPGAGKTMLARCLPSILPALTVREAIEATRIYSVAGLLDRGQALLATRPFRAPHHTISHAGLVGGGASPRPGEVSLAHLGVLFLDELPEFSRLALEALRQPVEDGLVTISRALTTTTYPARFTLVAAMNPCPCGYLGDRRHHCECPPHRVAGYRSRVSGPLMDRMDIAIEVAALGRREMTGTATGEPSAAVASRVAAARRRQLKRLAEVGVFCNAAMDARLTERFCRTDSAAAGLLESAIDRLALSARAYHRILKVARTIADLDAADRLGPAHLAEALSYRVVDRKGWHERQK